MPKKLNPETPEEQAKRFQEEAEKLVKSGDLDPRGCDAPAGVDEPDGAPRVRARADGHRLRPARTKLPDAPAAARLDRAQGPARLLGALDGGGHAVDFYLLNGHSLTGGDAYSLQLIEDLDAVVPTDSTVGQEECRSSMSFAHFQQIDDTCNHVHIDFGNAVLPGGSLILAGLLEGQADAVAQAYRRQGMYLADKIVRGHWPTLRMVKRRG